jgi:hypothetical protein
VSSQAARLAIFRNAWSIPYLSSMSPPGVSGIKRAGGGWSRAFLRADDTISLGQSRARRGCGALAVIWPRRCPSVQNRLDLERIPHPARGTVRSLATGQVIGPCGTFDSTERSTQRPLPYTTDAGSSLTGLAGGS